MIRGNDVGHRFVSLVGTCQFETFSDDCLGMIPLVAAIESIILRKNRLLDMDVQKQVLRLVYDAPYSIVD